MSNALAITLHALGAETAGGDGVAIDVGTLRNTAQLSIAAYAVTGVLAVVIQTSPDSAVWRTVEDVEIKEPLAPTAITLGGLERYLRVTWTVSGGSPSILWSLAGISHVAYIQPSDIIKYAVPPEALKDYEESDLVDACIAVSSDADDYLNGSYEMPISTWGESLRKNCAALAAGLLFRRRGCDPIGPDKLIFGAETTAITWFTRIADGHLKPVDIIDTTDDAFEGGSFVVTNPPRDW